MQGPLADHASDDALEAYSLGRLAEPELGLLEEHLLVCQACRARLQDSESAVLAARSALGRLQREPFSFTHPSKDGPVDFRVEALPNGQYRATVVGPQILHASTFQTVAEANEYILELFRTMFPDSDRV